MNNRDDIKYNLLIELIYIKKKTSK